MGVWRAEARKQGASKLMTPQHPVQTSHGFSLELPGGQSKQESRVVARVQEQGGLGEAAKTLENVPRMQVMSVVITQSGQ